jgi:Transglycosylase associated protein
VGGLLFGLLGITAGGLIGSIITATVGAALLLFLVRVDQEGLNTVKPSGDPSWQPPSVLAGIAILSCYGVRRAKAAIPGG